MSIGAIEYTRRAQIHRPIDNAALAREMQRLARNGLTVLDISVALRLALPAVKEMLGSGSQAA